MNHFVYGPTAGTITVYVPKRSTGHHFDNLGMITSLLSKKPAAAKMASKPLIEVLPGHYYIATYPMFHVSIPLALGML